MRWGVLSPRSSIVRAVRVLHLDPAPRGARPVGRRERLRHDARPHAAGLLEDRVAVLGGVGALSTMPIQCALLATIFKEGMR